jgi:RNA recognition motif-containing protein
MTLPNGMSKGCGFVSLFSAWKLQAERDGSVVEFSTREEAQKAIRELNDQVLLGRSLFIREVGPSARRTGRGGRCRAAFSREQSLIVGLCRTGRTRRALGRRPSAAGRASRDRRGEGTAGRRAGVRSAPSATAARPGTGPAAGSCTSAG